MPSQLTITAKTGPAVQNTAIVYTNVTSIRYDLAMMLLIIVTNGQIKEFDLTGVTTVTTTVSGVNYTITIS